MDVRRATEADIEAVVDLGAEMHAAGRFADFEYCRPKCRGLVNATITRPDLGFCVVAEKPNYSGPVGFMLACMDEFYFGTEKIAQELALYVVPAARGSSAAVRMMRAFDDWARESGARVAQGGISVGINNDAAAKFYGRFGFEPCGTAMRKEVR